MQRDGVEPVLPPISAGAHLVTYLFEAGPDAPGPMGPVELAHADIAAWRANTGTHLTPWEARTLRDLSRAYVAARHAGAEDGAPPPYTHRTTDEQRAAVRRQVQSMFRQRAAAANKGSTE